MRQNKSYYQYTDYQKEPGGLKKLDFIIKNIEEYQGTRKNKEIKILDIGCGRGNISLPLASLDYQVLGIDLDKNSIQELNKKNKFSNASFVLQDAAKINQKEKFDFIIASEVIEHLLKPQDFLRNIQSLLEERGVIIITIPNGNSLEENIRKFSTRNKLGQRVKRSIKQRMKEETIQALADSPHLHFFSLRQFKKILKSLGYNILVIKNQAAIFKESFYLFLRFFIRRGSRLFRFLDQSDCKLADFVSLNIGDGWMIVAKKEQKN